jgi:hypothetical protein
MSWDDVKAKLKFYGEVTYRPDGTPDPAGLTAFKWVGS